jgi:predicted RNase H-like HicB family nuclease
MKTADQYLRFVRWSDEDNHYVGYCPDLFPWGGVCHGGDEQETYRELRELIGIEISELVAAGKELPAAVTRPMREAIGV